MRVLVVDDQTIYRVGLKTMLEDADGVEFVGEAADGAAAIEACETSVPDVVLMDIRMPGIGGVEATRSIVTAHPEVAVLMLTMLEDETSLFAALRAGARGYLLKGAGPDQIVRAIIAAHDGDTVIGSGASDRLAALFRSAAPTPNSPFPQLTRRELEILELIATGANNATIASRLYLSDKTIRNNVTAIMSKLGVPDRAAIIVTARKRGLGTSG
ncbi:response regulator transcription factor [Subtercola sp. YIM 133946]|uniref:response regulator transcription factor n=1 Tax=Subtercola sp. YIM 133946 TaxID=3118909 RepID=UPI002F94AF5F